MNDNSETIQPTWWETLRAGMPVCKNWACFDHAAVAPLPDVTRQAMQAWTNDLCEQGVVNWSRWRKQIEQARRLGAKMIHADVDEIAMIRNTTEGVNLVVAGFPWQPGDNVVVPESEFPSNLYPWKLLKQQGVEVRLLPTLNEQIDLQQLKKACNAHTRIVALSWVGYARGWRVSLDDVAEIVHRAGALLFVDAIQGLGLFPLDVRQTEIDFLAADGHKWLLGPEGAGLFYLKKEHLELLKPQNIGWNSVQSAGDFDQREFVLKPAAARFEGGTYPMASMIGLLASLELRSQWDPAAIESRLRAMTDDLCSRLRSIGAEIASSRDDKHWSGIIAFDLPCRDLRTVKKQSLHEQVILNLRGGKLRVSPHVYNTNEDVEKLLSALAKK